VEYLTPPAVGKDAKVEAVKEKVEEEPLWGEELALEPALCHGR
jgi:hypothetical protein